jgi:fumarate reductase subunit D
MARPVTPFLWLTFSAGGTLAALLFPIHLFLFGLAIPLGFVAGPSYESLRALAAHPLARLYLFAFIALPLFHWAHRFRYTLYDGLQQKHLTELIAVLCYGTALVGSLAAAVVLWSFPH